MVFDSSHLLLIVGHYKSGSTWLLNMLSLHPDIHGMRESHIFHHVRHAPDLRRCTRAMYTAVPWSGGGLRNLARYSLVKHLARFVAQGRPALAFPVQDRFSTCHCATSGASTSV